jgi:hypothetical protein
MQELAGEQERQRVLLAGVDAITGVVADDHPRLGRLVPVLPPPMDLVPLGAFDGRITLHRGPLDVVDRRRLGLLLGGDDVDVAALVRHAAGWYLGTLLRY